MIEFTTSHPHRQSTASRRTLRPSIDLPRCLAAVLSALALLLVVLDLSPAIDGDVVQGAIHETENGGEPVPATVLGIPSDGKFWGRIQGNNADRRIELPNQHPERYLDRLLKAYTNGKDRVLDPFAGSGTTAVVAAASNRHCVTIDISEATCESVRQRIRKGAVRIDS